MLFPVSETTSTTIVVSIASY